MHPVDCYQAAVAEAKTEVKNKYGLDHHDYDNTHEAHTYWLECFDRAFARLLLRGK